MPPDVPQPRGRRVRLAAAIATVAIITAATIWIGSGTTSPDPVASEYPAASPAKPDDATTPNPLGQSFETIAAITDDFSRNAALYAMLRDADRGQIEHWLDRVDLLPPSPHRYDIARVLYIGLADIDPEAALIHALRTAPRASWVAAIFRSWASADPDAAANRAESLEEGAMAAAAWGLLQGAVSGDASPELAGRLDRKEAMAPWRRQWERLMGAVPPTRISLLLAEIEASQLARSANESSAAAWSRAILVEDPLVRRIVMEEVALEWAKGEPVDAIAAVIAWDGTDRVATRYQNQTSGSVTSLEWHIGEQILGDWSDTDPHAALAWVVEQNPTDANHYVHPAIGALARQFPDEAVASLATVPAFLQKEASGAVLRALSTQDLDRALGVFDALDISLRQEHLWSLAGPVVESRTPSEALEWAMSRDRRIRPDAVRRIVAEIHDIRPTAARDLVDNLDPVLHGAVLTEFARREVLRAPGEALAWARSLHDETQRPTLVSQVLTAWYYKDSEAAVREIAGLDEASVRDKVASDVISVAVRRADISQAERLFDILETPAARQRAAVTLHQYFAETEPDARKARTYARLLPDEGDVQ